MAPRLALLALSAIAASACGGGPLRVGGPPDGGAGSGGGAGMAAAGASGGFMIGIAGASAAGGGGAAGAGIAGAAGAGGTGIAGAGGSSATGTAGASVTGSGGAAGTSPIPPNWGLAAITRIADVLWNESPAGDVLVQAQQGRFQTANDLLAPIHVMLADPRAAKGVGKFYRWWLNLDAVGMTAKDPQLFPTYTPQLQADMANAVETFAVTQTLTNGTFGTLLTSPTTFVNGRLQDLYGVMGFTGDELHPITLPPGQAAGLLTQPALQVLGSEETRNDPPRRGTYILERFLCQTIPQSPANVPALPPPPPGTSLRQALATFIQGGPCSACHAVIDGPGLAFESFDAIGRWRTTDNGAPVDVSGLQLIGDAGEQFSGPIELAADLASSVKAQACLARQWLTFATGGNADQVTDADVAPVFASFSAANFDLQRLIMAVLTSDRFLGTR